MAVEKAKIKYDYAVHYRQLYDKAPQNILYFDETSYNCWNTIR